MHQIFQTGAKIYRLTLREGGLYRGKLGRTAAMNIVRIVTRDGMIIFEKGNGEEYPRSVPGRPGIILATSMSGLSTFLVYFANDGHARRSAHGQGTFALIARAERTWEETGKLPEDFPKIHITAYRHKWSQPEDVSGA
jgi:hypothetical protein